MNVECVVCGKRFEIERDDVPFAWCDNCKERVPIRKVEKNRVRVVSIFDSIIGEGRWMGFRATFLRLAGCNLRCETCDTKYAWSNGTEYDLDVLRYVLGNMVAKTKLLLITGGEPLLQKEAVMKIVNDYRNDMRVWIGLETNGTILLNEDEIGRFDLITVSPKNGHIGIEELREWARYDFVDFKFVIGSGKWCWTEKEIESVIRVCNIERENVWLMPHTIIKGEEVVLENAREVWDMALRLGVNYSDRLHMRVWGNKRDK